MGTRAEQRIYTLLSQCRFKQAINHKQNSIMRKLVTLTLCALFTLSCHAQSDNKEKGKCRHITAAEYNKLVDDTSDQEWNYLGNKPAIIDFYADWCGPCQKLAPILEEIAKEQSKNLVIYKINVDEEPELANSFGITGIPALLYIPLKGEPQMVTGYMPKEGVEKKIKELLK